MSDRPEHQDTSTEKKDELHYTPASPVKRTLAWIGIVYMVIVVVLTTYIYFNGAALGNLAPLLTVPGLIGLGVLALVGWRTEGRPGKWTAIAVAAAAWLLAAVTLPVGIAGLLSNFGEVFLFTNGGG